MGKGGKKGPPYLNNPHATFIVIEHPWGRGDNRSNTEGFVNNVGTWVRLMSRQQGRLDPSQDLLPETIYTRNTTDTVIVQLPEIVDIGLYLGAHKWSEFLEPGALRGNESTISNIFEYNYRNNGDPANHNWSERYPRKDLPPLPPPILSPYPPPSYAQRPPSLVSLTKAMPEPIPPTPPPVVPFGKLEEKPSLESLDRSAEDKSAIKPLVDKSDPFEEEDTATRFLQSAQVKTEPEESKPIRIKQEALNEYQPSSDYFALASQHHFAKAQQHLEVKNEALDQKPMLNTYEPEANLETAIQHHLAQRQMVQRTADLVKEEQSAMLDLPSPPRDPRKRPLDRSKRLAVEEQEGSGHLKRMKVESK